MSEVDAAATINVVEVGHHILRGQAEQTFHKMGEVRLFVICHVATIWSSKDTFLAAFFPDEITNKGEDMTHTMAWWKSWPGSRFERYNKEDKVYQPEKKIDNLSTYE